MVTLSKSLQAWKSEQFELVLKSEILALESGSLPLSRATTQGGVVDENSVSLSVLSSDEDDASINVVMAVFFSEIVGGCSCGDDPLEANGHCEMKLSIDKSTAMAEFTLI